MQLSRQRVRIQVTIKYLYRSSAERRWLIFYNSSSDSSSVQVYVHSLLPVCCCFCSNQLALWLIISRFITRFNCTEIKVNKLTRWWGEVEGISSVSAFPVSWWNIYFFALFINTEVLVLEWMFIASVLWVFHIFNHGCISVLNDNSGCWQTAVV